MIDIAKLTEADKGREVRYNCYGTTEWGRITSWNERWIFVRYHTRQIGRNQKHERTGTTSEASDPASLEFCS